MIATVGVEVIVPVAISLREMFDQFPKFFWWRRSRPAQEWPDVLEMFGPILEQRLNAGSFVISMGVVPGSYQQTYDDQVTACCPVESRPATVVEAAYAELAFQMNRQTSLFGSGARTGTPVPYVSREHFVVGSVLQWVNVYPLPDEREYPFVGMAFVHER